MQIVAYFYRNSTKQEIKLCYSPYSDEDNEVSRNLSLVAKQQILLFAMMRVSAISGIVSGKSVVKIRVNVVELMYRILSCWKRKIVNLYDVLLDKNWSFA